MSILISLLAVEAFLRITGYSYPTFYMPDVDRGIALRPGMAGWYRKEGAAYIRINSVGLRDDEHSKLKPVNTFRIAILGDSYAEALQIPMNETFWKVMESELKVCQGLAGKQVEVINFGVSGYGTAQELITLRRDVWEYSPDQVVLVVTASNDISDNSRTLKKTDEIPYFVYRNGELMLDDSFRQLRAFRLRQSAVYKTGRWISDNLRIIQAIHQAHHTLKALIAARATPISAPAPPGTDLQATRIRPGQEVGIDNRIYLEPVDPVWIDAWNVTEGLIITMAKEIKSRGAKFLVVTLSSGIQVHPSREARDASTQRLGITDVFYPDRRIKQLGDREGIEVLTLAPSLQKYAEMNGVFLHGFGKEIGNGHWNSIGHHVAGEIMAQQICTDLSK